MFNPTSAKQIKIIAVYVAILLVIILAIVYFKSPSATCADGVQNQGEKAVDCGGPCAPCKEISDTRDIVVQESGFVQGNNDTYDVYARINNPNGTIGAKEFSYKFTLSDESGNVVATKSGKSFLLPADSRYIAEIGIPTEKNIVTKISFTIENPQLEKLPGVGKPQIGIYNKKLGKSQAGEFSEASGTIRNESPYDLGKIYLTILLRDENGKVVGMNSTQRDSVRAGEERDFILSWPTTLPASVQKMEVDPQSNIYDPDNLSVLR